MTRMGGLAGVVQMSASPRDSRSRTGLTARKLRENHGAQTRGIRLSGGDAAPKSLSRRLRNTPSGLRVNCAEFRQLTLNTGEEAQEHEDPALPGRAFAAQTACVMCGVATA